MEYIPPHPYKGTKYHRYVVVVLEQLQGEYNEKIGNEGEEFSNKEFSVRQYIGRRNKSLLPVGLTFWRTEWDENVENILQSLNLPSKQFERIV